MSLYGKKKQKKTFHSTHFAFESVTVLCAIIWDMTPCNLTSKCMKQFIPKQWYHIPNCTASHASRK
jgi:hypothetical protein